MAGFEHEPVLVREVLAYLNLQPGGIYIDCTVGGGGHSSAILQDPAGVSVIGIDQDHQALQHASQHLANYSPRVRLIQGNFRNLEAIAAAEQLRLVDGILMDIGVSSYQLDTAERGFSYQQDAPLDMRMDPHTQSLDAAQVVNEASVEELTRIIFKYGEERWAARIARFIAAKRAEEPLRTTGELVAVIKAAVPAKAREAGPHPAKRTFQALRIYVNGELDALQNALLAAVPLLGSGGRLVVISFHSLEDRIVKDFIREQTGICRCPPGLPICRCGAEAVLKNLTAKPVTASAQELRRNSRSRSAKLRAAERLGREG